MDHTFALCALFEDETRARPDTVEAILDAFSGGDRQRLVDYLNDPIGVRQWVLSSRSFFTGTTHPFVSRRAMLRLREARVAAAYGMLGPACAMIDITLSMSEARRQEVQHALSVYADGVQRAFQKPVEEPAAVTDLEINRAVATGDVVVEATAPAVEQASPPAPPARKSPRKPAAKKPKRQSA